MHVSKGASADNVAGFVQHLRNHNGSADNITSVAIDMSLAFIKGVTEHLPKAAITFDKFHVIAHASEAVDNMRRLEQKTDPGLKRLGDSEVAEITSEYRFLGSCFSIEYRALFGEAPSASLRRSPEDLCKSNIVPSPS